MGALLTPTRVIRPLTITDAILTSTDVTDSNPEYSSATAYVTDDVVKVTTTSGGAATATNKLYTAQQATTGDDPTTDDGTYWVELSSTNPWKMFDDVPQDQSSKATSITVTLTPGQIVDSLALINVLAEEVQISITSVAGGGTVYDKTFSLIDVGAIGGWYEFFFEPVSYTSDFVRTDLPVYGDEVITVTITNTSGTVLVGALILGQFGEIGSATMGSTFGLVDYSTTSIDAQGRFTIVPGTYSKRADLVVDCETRLWSGVQAIFHDLRNTPAVWIADEEMTGSIIYGYYRTYLIMITNPVLTRIQMTIQGLTAT